jgi:hypothetical protein
MAVDYRRLHSTVLAATPGPAALSAVLAALALAWAAPAFAQPGQTEASPVVVGGGDQHRSGSRLEQQVPPLHQVIRRHFRPWARPSPRQVREIIRVEALRWQIDPLRLERRVRCESRLKWWAERGIYRGVLQFHPATFVRGLRTLGDRRVMLVRRQVRTVYETRIVHYLDGEVVRERGRAYRQSTVHIYTGTLPQRPELTHGWAQLRIGAQSLRGISAVRSSEWACAA